MIYLERIPAAPLRPFVRALWYAQAKDSTHSHERMLPSGCAQVILNLARDFLLDCPENQPERAGPPSLVVGARSVYEIVSGLDMTSLIGIVFEPGGFAPFASDAVDLFSNRYISLEEVWGAPARNLRDRLREIPQPSGRLCFLEEFLHERFAVRLSRHPIVDFALRQFGREPFQATVREVANSTGWSQRRFSQIFREQVGFTPKLWCRIQRFQRAVRQLHAGVDQPWTELALECGFYDQSHFANEFRAFSGIDATTYSALRTEWTNHVPAD